MTVKRYSGKMYCSTDGMIVGYKENMVSGEDYDQIKAAYDLLNAQVVKSAEQIGGLAASQARDIALVGEKVEGLIQLAEGLQVDADRYRWLRDHLYGVGHLKDWFKTYTSNIGCSRNPELDQLIDEARKDA